MTYSNYTTSLLALIDGYTPLATVREDDPTQQLAAVLDGVDYPAALVAVSVASLEGENVSRRTIQYPTELVVLDRAAYDQPATLNTQRNATLEHIKQIIARLREVEQNNEFGNVERIEITPEIDPINLRSEAMVGWRLSFSVRFDTAITKNLALWP